MNAQDGTISKQGSVEVTKDQAGKSLNQEQLSECTKFAIHGSCDRVSKLLSRIGDKWSVLIVSLLGNETMRFSEIKKHVGSISQKMLTTTLRNLERDGFVKRTVYPTIPPKVEYELTNLGRELLVPVSALGRWAIENGERVEAAREEFDAKAQNPQSGQKARFAGG